RRLVSSFFFFHERGTPDLYTLSLHDALPISTAVVTSEKTIKSSGILRRIKTPVTMQRPNRLLPLRRPRPRRLLPRSSPLLPARRSEEHTSELQSLTNLVCRLLLEKKKHRDKH